MTCTARLHVTSDQRAHWKSESGKLAGCTITKWESFKAALSQHRKAIAVGLTIIALAAAAIGLSFVLSPIPAIAIVLATAVLISVPLANQPQLFIKEFSSKSF